MGGTGCGVGSKGYMAGWRSQLYSQHYSPPGLGHGATDGGAGFGAYLLPNDLSADSLLWCCLFSLQFSLLGLELLVRAWSGAVGAAVQPMLAGVSLWGKGRPADPNLRVAIQVCSMRGCSTERSIAAKCCTESADHTTTARQEQYTHMQLLA